MASFEYRLDKDVSEADLIAKVTALNKDDDVHGILVQFPVPPHISQQTIIETISPSKDVDGLNPSMPVASPRDWMP